MKWLIGLVVLITGDLYLSAQLVAIYPPYMLVIAYTTLLVSGVLVLISQKKIIIKDFRRATDYQNALQKNVRKKRKIKQNPRKSMQPLIRLSLFLLCLIFLIVPGLLTSLVGLALASKRVISGLTSHLLSGEGVSGSYRNS